MQQTGVDLAIKAVGTAKALATPLGVSPQAVGKWLKEGVVPPERVLDVERLSGVPCYLLNPIIYPPVRFAAANDPAFHV